MAELSNTEADDDGSDRNAVHTPCWKASGRRLLVREMHTHTHAHTQH